MSNPLSLTYNITTAGTDVGLFLGNANNITINWGDGSQTGPITNTPVTQYIHTYATIN